MEWLARSDRPLLTDTFDTEKGSFEEWAPEVERWVRRLGGHVLGAIPRTSAFEWKWEWGPPEEDKRRVDVGGRTILINPEASLVVAAPPGREAEFAREYYRGIRKEAPLAQQKEPVLAEIGRVWPRVMPYVRDLGDVPKGKWGSKIYRKSRNALEKLQNQEAQLHRESWQMGDKIAPIGWYEPDVRGNYEVGEGWQWGRLTATPEGVHYISHDTGKPGPRILVDPDIARWIGYSEVAEDDVYKSGQRGYAATMRDMDEETRLLMQPIAWSFDIEELNQEFAQEALYTRYGLDYEQKVFGLPPNWTDEEPDDTKWDKGLYAPEFRVPFKVGGWVAVYGSRVYASPFARGPYANIGNGPLRVLWVNGNGDWGYSSYPASGPGSLGAMRASLGRLRATIRPIRDFATFEMPPKRSLDAVLKSNTEMGWPLDRLIALARGEIEVNNPTLQWWDEEGVPEQW